MRILRKISWCLVLSLYTGLTMASPPPLPIAGDLTDQQGNPLNETVTLTFSLTVTESETSEVLWSEKHDNVTVKQGRFAVLLGSRKPLLNINDKTDIDFTQRKYIKVEIKRDGKEESYALTPPLIYMPTLGSWQAVHADKAKYVDRAEHADKAKHAVQADNTAKLEGHGWEEIRSHMNKISENNSELEKVKSELETAKKNLDDIKRQLGELTFRVDRNTGNDSAIHQIINNFSNRVDNKVKNLDDRVKNLENSRPAIGG